MWSGEVHQNPWREKMGRAPYFFFLHVQPLALQSVSSMGSEYECSYHCCDAAGKGPQTI